MNAAIIQHTAQFSYSFSSRNPCSWSGRYNVWGSEDYSNFIGSSSGIHDMNYSRIIFEISKTLASWSGNENR